MRAPWHIRAWATGASLAINGALALGVMQMAPTMATVAQEEKAMLVSLGDPSLTQTDNATSPDARPAPEPEEDLAPARPAPVEPPVEARVKRLAADAWTTSPSPPRALAPASAAAETEARAATPAPAATPVAAKAMVATAAKPLAGSDKASSVQAHVGSSTSYIARVRAWLESNKAYPKAARMRKQEGVARIVFVIDRSGHVLDCRLAAPTGHPLLDQEVLAMVARSDPFPPPPHTIKGDRIEMEAPVEFALAR